MVAKFENVFTSLSVEVVTILFYSVKMTRNLFVACETDDRICPEGLPVQWKWRGQSCSQTCVLKSENLKAKLMQFSKHCQFPLSVHFIECKRQKMEVCRVEKDGGYLHLCSIAEHVSLLGKVGCPSQSKPESSSHRDFPPNVLAA